MKKRLFVLCGALWLVASFTLLAFGQNKAPAKAKAATAAPASAPRQLLNIRFLRIKSGMNAEWQEFRKNESLPMLRKAGTKEQTVSVASQFGETGYFIVTPIENLSQYDGQGAAVRALGQEGAAAYGAKNARFTESTHALALEMRPELSMPPAQNYQAKIFVLTTTTVAPGRDEEYETLVRTAVLPAIKKSAPKGYLIGRVAYGGATNQYMSAVFVDSWADLQRYREAFAKESAAARVGPKSAGIVTGRENAIYRFVPELSIVPTMP
jgi:hypothetical protein